MGRASRPSTVEQKKTGETPIPHFKPHHQPAHAHLSRRLRREHQVPHRSEDNAQIEDQRPILHVYQIRLETGRDLVEPVASPRNPRTYARPVIPGFTKVRM